MISVLAERSTGELARVEAALKRIDAGTYGRCEMCCRRLALERLQALPLTTTCVRCQRSQEAAWVSPRQPDREWPDNHWWSNDSRSARSIHSQAQFCC